uniref:NOT2/NOT3/NOT5 C-terminal domain-containing protein n=1 Tax=Proboscia inermis TaxID=420281 RepID=A0A7S0C8Q4_9STRA
MTTEDFPALPGAPGGGSSSLGSSQLLVSSNGQRDMTGQTSYGGLSSVAPNSHSSGNSSNPLGLPSAGEDGVMGVGGGGVMYDGSSTTFRGHNSGLGSVMDSGLGGGSAVLTGSGVLGPQGSSAVSGLAQQRTTLSTTSTGGGVLSGDYGLLGLLGVIRMSDADRNALALGSDLTLLGLNLNSSEHLYSTFASPWSDSPTTREPQYQLPMCYYMQPPALKTGHLSKFQLETLFYIFYALPKDVLQAYAAQELYSRDWRYHVDLKLWFKRASPVDVPNANGTQYIYFDINSWERRIFNGSMHQNFPNGFLSEEDVRVKFPSS